MGGRLHPHQANSGRWQQQGVQCRGRERINKKAEYYVVIYFLNTEIVLYKGNHAIKNVYRTCTFLGTVLVGLFDKQVCGCVVQHSDVSIPPCVICHDVTHCLVPSESLRPPAYRHRDRSPSPMRGYLIPSPLPTRRNRTCSA